MRWLPAAALVASALAACGGAVRAAGGDKATYERTGNAICEDYRAALAKLGQPTRAGQLGRYIAQATPVLERTVRRIGRLAPPAPYARAFRAFRDAARQTVARGRALRAAAEQADSGEVQRLLREAAAARSRRQGLARAAGLAACAEL